MKLCHFRQSFWIKVFECFSYSLTFEKSSKPREKSISRSSFAAIWCVDEVKHVNIDKTHRIPMNNFLMIACPCRMTSRLLVSSLWARNKRLTVQIEHEQLFRVSDWRIFVLISRRVDNHLLLIKSGFLCVYVLSSFKWKNENAFEVLNMFGDVDYRLLFPLKHHFALSSSVLSSLSCCFFFSLFFFFLIFCVPQPPSCF